MIWIGTTPIDVGQTFAFIYLLGQPVIWAVFLLSLRYGRGWSDSGEDKAKVIEVLIFSWVWPLMLVIIIMFLVIDQVLKFSLDPVVNSLKKARRR